MLRFPAMYHLIFLNSIVLSYLLLHFFERFRNALKHVMFQINYDNDILFVFGVYCAMDPLHIGFHVALDCQ